MKQSATVVLVLALCVLNSAAQEEGTNERCTGVTCPSEGSPLLANPSDCASYCQCSYGTPWKHNCPSGLQFNSATGLCDWPENVNCNLNKIATFTPRPSATTRPPATPTRKFCPPNVSARCPAANDQFGFAIHLPYPGDCSKFCKCDWGQAIEFACPPGLHFNAELEVCDWPESAGCSAAIPPQLPLCPSTVTRRCSAQSSNYPLPYPGNCSKFCVCSCDRASATAVSCPNGLYFNAASGVCDFPSNTNCGIVEPTPPNDPSKQLCPSQVSARCPAQNDQFGFAIHLPYPRDCSKFCKCDWGQAIEFNCPDGLHFNEELQVCDWPAEAKCDPTSGGGNGGGNDPGGEYAVCPPSVVCPPGHMDGNATLLPHPTSCSNFCKCSWNVAYLYKCPADLVFNNNLKVCDWKRNVVCRAPRA